MSEPRIKISLEFNSKITEFETLIPQTIQNLVADTCFEPCDEHDVESLILEIFEAQIISMSERKTQAVATSLIERCSARTGRVLDTQTLKGHALKGFKKPSVLKCALKYEGYKTYKGYIFRYKNERKRKYRRKGHTAITVR